MINKLSVGYSFSTDCREFIETSDFLYECRGQFPLIMNQLSITKKRKSAYKKPSR